MDIEIRDVALDDVPGLRATWQVEVDVRAHDTPTFPPYPFEELLTDQGDDNAFRRIRIGAWSDGRAVGFAFLMLPLRDNTAMAEFELMVTPDARGQGVGSALLETVVDRARAEGRGQLVVPTGEPFGTPDTPGRRFAVKHDFTPVLDEVSRMVDLDEVSDEMLATLETEAASHAAGYELVQWAGPAPDELVDDLAVLNARLSTDAPFDDLQVEAQVWDAERFRSAEARNHRLGRTWVTTAVRHVGTGRLVGYTDIGVSTYEPDPGYQWTTVVEPEHRGHRLGLLVKAANLRLLRHALPETRRIITWNAASNKHMIAINEQVGFRKHLSFTQWQRFLT